MMVWLVNLFYNCIVLPTLQVVLWVGGLGRGKLRLRLHAVRRLNAGYPTRHNATASTSGSDPSHSPSIWFHAASMGEFEQLSPVISHVRTMLPTATITVTVFSISGIKSAEQHSAVDDVRVLPVDTKRAMRKLVRELAPSIVVVDRYDLWPNLVHAINQFGAPLLLINATFPSAATRRFLRSWVARTYRRCTAILAVNEQHASAFRQLVSESTRTDSSSRTVTHSPTVTIVPDTRIDRVLASMATPLPEILAFRAPSVSTIVVGSCWPPDEELLVDAIQQLRSLDVPGVDSALSRLRFIFVPHEPKPPTVLHLQDLFSATPWSKATLHTPGNLVVDSVGLLLHLYAIADAAYVGGGFGAGVHSVTEPAAHGMPVACGPYIDRSPDAQQLAAAGLLSTIATPADLVSWIRDIVLTPAVREAHAAQTYQTVREGEGSSFIVATKVIELLDESSK